MDLTATIAPKSDQLNADDLISGPREVTIERVTPGSAEQPVDVHLVEQPGRAYRPSKSMRRVMVAAWGPDTTAYAGRRMVLYRDASVKFGGDVVGGIKISHLSHIEKRLSLALTVTRGKRKAHIVEPLPEAATQQAPDALPTPEDIAAATDRDALTTMWHQFPDGHPARTAIKARVAELDAPDGNADS